MNKTLDKKFIEKLGTNTFWSRTLSALKRTLWCKIYYGSCFVANALPKNEFMPSVRQKNIKVIFLDLEFFCDKSNNWIKCVCIPFFTLIFINKFLQDEKSRASYSQLIARDKMIVLFTTLALVLPCNLAC